MRAPHFAALCAAVLAFAASGAYAADTPAPVQDLNNPAPFGSPVADEQIYSQFLIDQLEGRFGDGGTSLKWETEGWTGTDELRLQFRSEGERLSSGRVEDGQQELFVAKPISTYWNVQVGGRYDLDSAPGRAWGAIGIEGIAPRFFHVIATAYAGEKGLASKVEVSYDQLITNRLMLEPEGELNAYSENDPARRIGSGFSDLDAGLRLQYQITRKFAPYVGAVWEQTFGKTADLDRAAHEKPGDVRLAIGLRSWF
jgi:copper resistance protein B